MVRRILMLLTVVAMMVVMLAIAVGPAFAFHKNPIFETHPLFGEHTLLTGDCGQGNCTGFGDQGDNPGETKDGDTGDERNEACEVNGVCIGTRNN